MDGRTAVADVCALQKGILYCTWCVYRCSGQPGNVVCAMQCVHLCICNDHQCEVLHYNKLKHLLCAVKNSEDGQMCVLQHCNQLQVPANFVLFCKPQNISPLKECKSMKCIDRSQLVVCDLVSLPMCCAMDRGGFGSVYQSAARDERFWPWMSLFSHWVQSAWFSLWLLFTYHWWLSGWLTL